MLPAAECRELVSGLNEPQAPDPLFVLLLFQILTPGRKCSAQDLEDHTTVSGARVQAFDEEVDGLDPGDLRECCSPRAGNCHDVWFTAAEEASVLHRYQRMRRQSLITLQG
ncbi:hypothetical protein NDU88_000709 [Pleurodeles waltl]|uniref:Uncharacterized protein n=1 Tax=Pleurodeles waltl TaxID=8319 RepID=A0AAV7WJT3_PLEWA|nr:hypothetical protein NDU88_000709 [Pleurodeles waltl]